MKVLLVKTSSLGDIVHAFPAVTDAARTIPGIRFEWLVEEAFVDAPSWHPAVDGVIPVALRRWRIKPGTALREWPAFKRRVRAIEYDIVLDAQGLMKSAALGLLARGLRCGPDHRSAREPVAAWAYRRRIAVPRERHAIDRLRALFAGALGYPTPTTEPDYGIVPPRSAAADYVLLLPATSWSSKRWPDAHWAELAHLADRHGLEVRTPWRDDAQKAQAARLIERCPKGRSVATPRLNDLAAVIGGARAVAAADTGAAHMAAAFGVPAVTIYGATSPSRTGTVGPSQIHLTADFPCSPCGRRVCRYRGPAEVRPACYGTVSPARVWDSLAGLLGTPR